MKAPPVTIKTVLITGCSSGIGLAIAKRLRDQGWHVSPTARKSADLDMLRAEGFDPIQLDVADSDSIRIAAETVLKRYDGQLGALVNNAGFGIAAAMEDCSRDMLRSVFEVNLFGLQELTNCFIPTFRKQGYGRIVNISSVLGELSIPFSGAYSASKFAVEAASDALRRELNGSGVAVSIVQPGPIDTRFSQNLAHRTDEFERNPNSPFYAFYQDAIETRKNGTAGRTADRFMKPPEAVAATVLRCLDSSTPPRRTCVTVVAYFGRFIRRFWPTSLIDAIVAYKLRQKLQHHGS